ncbi:MAG: hypothetical protein WCK01_00435 [Candidatus Uhrbacteria bacterium]
MSQPDKSNGKKLVITVTSDLPILVGLEPWERDAVLPVALELLVPLVQGLKDDAAAQEEQYQERRPLRTRLDR